ncbi:MAG: hypothetical protein WBZ25_09440, partial [Pseudolabrys sp.]
MTFGQRYKRTGQSTAKTPLAGHPGAIQGVFKRFELAQLNRTLITGSGHRPAEQAQCNFARQFGKTAGLDR